MSICFVIHLSLSFLAYSSNIHIISAYAYFLFVRHRQNIINHASRWECWHNTEIRHSELNISIKYEKNKFELTLLRWGWKNSVHDNETHKDIFSLSNLDLIYIPNHCCPYWTSFALLTLDQHMLFIIAIEETIVIKVYELTLENMEITLNYNDHFDMYFDFARDKRVWFPYVTLTTVDHEAKM